MLEENPGFKFGRFPFNKLGEYRGGGWGTCTSTWRLGHPLVIHFFYLSAHLPEPAAVVTAVRKGWQAGRGRVQRHERGAEGGSSSDSVSGMGALRRQWERQ